MVKKNEGGGVKYSIFKFQMILSTLIDTFALVVSAVPEASPSQAAKMSNNMIGIVAPTGLQSLEISQLRTSVRSIRRLINDLILEISDDVARKNT